MTDRLKAAVPFVLMVPLFYFVVACTVFRFRNPTANDAACYRELPAVLRFEKLKGYQWRP